ncbi:dihydroorotate dehydrogenase electron transfer subunit [Lactococcus termiticola]|uniref:Dihydroorotate dehydrogenase B (NAD(+)), electron transfer subunit n=1 Tax=Lactococcus termiticola TaxID=2169526 RepID=A0A2R5HI51_9LACT|nr:dihydroorotate dehydrogenase electron transfer subunit [Lactococcus termiticola]GBG97165.1 dihydroorotate dehydrogenase [Lactococcus termiticola]
MAILQEMMTIKGQREVAKDIFELVLTGELVADLAQPGRFLDLAVPNDSMLLRRPISISSWDKAEKTVTLLYRAGDETTGTRALATLETGDRLDVLGPLGNGFEAADLKAGDSAVLVGGGIGVPPLYELAKQLVAKGVKVTVILGFASQSVMILEEAFQALGVEVQIATDDGSYGTVGHVGLLLNELTESPSAVYACGPNVMLKAVANFFDGKTDNIQLSLEERMACGIGACYACVVHDKEDETKAYKVCNDGPVFQAGKVSL